MAPGQWKELPSAASGLVHSMASSSQSSSHAIAASWSSIYLTTCWGSGTMWLLSPSVRRLETARRHSKVSTYRRTTSLSLGLWHWAERFSEILCLRCATFEGLTDWLHPYNACCAILDYTLSIRAPTEPYSLCVIASR